MSDRKLNFSIIFLTVFSSLFLGYFINLEPGQNRKSVSEALVGFSVDTENQTSKESGLIPVGKRSALSLSLVGEKGIIFVDKNSGDLVEYDVHTSREVVLERPNNLVDIVYLRSNDLRIGIFSDKEGTLYKYYNPKTGLYSIIDKDIQAINLSPLGEVAYIKNDGDIKRVVVLNFKNGEKRELFKGRSNLVDIGWYDQFQVLVKLLNPYGGFDYYLTGQSGFHKFLNNVDDSEGKWSPDGKQLLFSRKNDQTDEHFLFLSDKDGVETELSVITSSDRCVWLSESNLICGIIKNSLLDELFIISTVSKKIELLYSPEFPLKTGSMKVTEDGGYLFLINKFDSKIYSLKIDP